MTRLTPLLSLAGALVLLGCVGDIGDDGAGTDGPVTDPSGFSCDPEAAALTASPITRLARGYHHNAVAELLSPLDDAAKGALLEQIRTRLELIPKDIAETYAASDQSISQEHVDAVFGVGMGLAAAIADDAAPYATQLVGVCGPGSTPASLADDACLTTLVTFYGRKAFRRPLTQGEIDDFKAFYAQAEAQGIDGLAMIMGRLVAHPNFYYRFDSEGALVEGTEGVDAVYELTKWELASKMAFLFWAGPPSDALLDRVESTDITQDDALAAVVDEVLADPRTERGLLRFYREWLHLDHTAQTPGTTGNVVAGQAMLAAAGIDMVPASYREDMIQEVIDLAKHYTLTTDGTLGDILTSPYSFAKTAELAQIYGVPTWDGSSENLVSLPASERSGLLTRAALVTSSAEYTRPIVKGDLIRTRLLCDAIPPPPANLDIKPLILTADKTTRQAVEEATASAECQACHTQLNPVGFLTEAYDPIGRFRQKEIRFAEGTADVVAELPIDTSAAAGIGEEVPQLTDAVDLSQYLAETGAANVCMVANYFEFVNGRDADPITDGCDVLDMRDRLTEDGGSIKSMLRRSVLQESFRRRLVK